MIHVMATTRRTGGLTEIGELFGISRQRASAVVRKVDFPAPIASSRAGRIWDLAEVEAWGQTWDRSNPGGRPPASGMQRGDASA